MLNLIRLLPHTSGEFCIVIGNILSPIRARIIVVLIPFEFSTNTPFVRSTAFLMGRLFQPDSQRNNVQSNKSKKKLIKHFKQIFFLTEEYLTPQALRVLLLKLLALPHEPLEA